jgi:hypothetical protein
MLSSHSCHISWAVSLSLSTLSDQRFASICHFPCSCDMPCPCRHPWFYLHLSTGLDSCRKLLPHRKVPYIFMTSLSCKMFKVILSLKS